MNEMPKRPSIETEASPKIVVGVRVPPILKNILTAEANNLQISLSEYCELILFGRDHNNEEIMKIKQVLSEKDSTIAQLNQQLTDNIAAQLIQKSFSDKAVNDINKLLTDKRLLSLFETLREKSDVIENSRGENIPIVYRSVTDLLFAMIYSFTLKK